MTERIPAGMTTEQWAEQQIRHAIERGDLEAPSAKGRPLEIKARHDPNWWLNQKLADEDAAPIPPAIRMRLEHDELVDALVHFRRRADVVAAVSELNGRIRYANSHGLPGPPSTLMPMDLDHHLARWDEADALRPSPPVTTPEVAAPHRSWWRRLFAGNRDRP